MPAAASAVKPKRAIVLSGGGARGAYEAGALRYLLDEFPERTGLDPHRLARQPVPLAHVARALLEQLGDRDALAGGALRLLGARRSQHLVHGGVEPIEVLFHAPDEAVAPLGIEIVPTDPPATWSLRMTRPGGGDLIEDPMTQAMEVEDVILILGYQWD